MSTIKTVALAGASGNLGPAILNALLETGRFQVTILTRFGSTTAFPSSAKVIHVDYNSLQSLTNALHGQDAVISTLAMLAHPVQILMIDAAIAAGVKRFIPSEFGFDTNNPRSRLFPICQGKVAIQEYLEQKSKDTALTYTLIITGPFFDWNLQMGNLINFKDRKATLYDGGDRPFSTVRLSGIGAAVTGVLTHPQETRNRSVNIQEAVVTQNQLIEIARQVAPGRKWETELVSTENIEKEARQNLAGPEQKRDPRLMLNFMLRAVFGENYGGEMTSVDNELLGVRMMSDDEIKELVEGYVEQ